MRVQMMCLSIVAASLTLMLPPAVHAQWQVTNTFHPGGEGGWDYLTVDTPNHRLFVTRASHTQAIDISSGKLLSDIPGQIRSHGVALVPKLNRGFITDGGGKGAILIFDLKTYAVLGSIPTMPDSDGIIYDDTADRVLAVSGDGNALMVFDPKIDAKKGRVETIQLGGAPEFLASDGRRVYINLEDKHVVAVVDLVSRKVVNRWSVAPGGQPVGMALDRAHHRLFIGCRNPQKMIVMNTDTGKVEADFPIGAGVDATGYDQGQAFASCGDGSLTIIGEKGSKLGVEQVVKTAQGARTMGVDHKTHTIFLPTAQMEPAVAGHRPQPKPGTFEIVVVSRK